MPFHDLLCRRGPQLARADVRRVVVDGSGPPRGPFGRSLSAVSCATSTFCVATSITTGVFVFDGTSWTLTPRLEVNTAGIDSVSCPTTTFCVAAGHAGTVHRFDGARWHDTDVDPPRAATSGPSPVPRRGSALPWTGPTP